MLQFNGEAITKGIRVGPIASEAGNSVLNPFSLEYGVTKDSALWLAEAHVDCLTPFLYA